MLMFIKSSTRKQNWKTYITNYLVESYRDKKDWKVKHRNLANLSKLPNKSLLALKNSLNKSDSEIAKYKLEDLEVVASKEYGSILVFQKIFNDIFWKIISNKYKNEIMAMTINRIFEPQSKHSLKNWTKQVDWLKEINDNNLYKAIDYLEANQKEIEKKLFKKRKKEKCELYLYDITSTYFEWEAVEMAKYWYSRDKRNDRLQVNIWLVTDSKWFPITVEILEWNINDKSTLQPKIDELKDRFGITEVTIVFDRWMKTKINLEYIQEEWFDYITALNHTELKKKSEENKLIQQSLFDKENLSEFTIEDKKYVLSYNPAKASKDTEDRKLLIERTESKLKEIQNFKRRYKPKTLQDKVSRKINKYKCEKYLDYEIEEEEINGEKYWKLVFERKEEKIRYDEKYDWFYMIKSTRTDIKWEELEKKYKSLQTVENSFDYVKNLIEIRPVFHWKDRRVKWHIFMCFMSYYLLQEFREKTKDLLEDHTLNELLTELKSINKVYFKIENIMLEKIETMNELQKNILKQFKIKM